MNIIFKVSDNKDIVLIRKQLDEKERFDIKVVSLEYIGKVDELNVKPNKEYAELLDLANITKLHGFPSESYTPPINGDKSQLLKAKSKASCQMISLLTNEEPTPVFREQYDLFVEEINRRSKSLRTMEMKDIKGLYEVTMDINQIVHIAYEMYYRMHEVSYRESTLEWVLEPILAFINDFPDYEYRIIRTYRTRAKNITIQKKKLAALRFFDQWLRTMPPYNIDNEPLTVGSETISDEEVPF
ncbi:MAG: hypothetical protein ACTSU7_09280 [Candidatus Heimdallarchaeaceae archaeon]